jgi:hypothetical protein
LFIIGGCQVVAAEMSTQVFAGEGYSFTVECFVPEQNGLDTVVEMLVMNGSGGSHVNPTRIWASSTRHPDEYGRPQLDIVWFNIIYYFDGDPHTLNGWVYWDLWGWTCYGHPEYYLPYHSDPPSGVHFNGSWWGDDIYYIMVNVGHGNYDYEERTFIYDYCNMFTTPFHIDNQPPYDYSWWFYRYQDWYPPLPWNAKKALRYD